MSQAYESITAYDVPQVLAGQAVQGRLTPSNVRRTLLDSSSLSPGDRRELSRVIADKTGMGGLPEGAIDFATNPFILLLALTRAPGASALRQGSLQAVREGKSAYSTVYRPWLHRWLMGVAEATRGTELYGVVGRFANRMETYGNYVHAEMAAAEAGVVKRINQIIEQKHGRQGKLKALEFRGLRRNSPEYRELRKFNRVLAARASKEHLDYAQDVAQGMPRFVVRAQKPDGSWGSWRKFEGHRIGKTDPSAGELYSQLDQLQRGRIASMEKGGRRYQFRHAQPEISQQRTTRPARMEYGALEGAWKEYGLEGEAFARTAADTRRWVRWKMLGDESSLPTWQDEKGNWHQSVRDDLGEVVPFVFDERKVWRFAKRLANENKHLSDEAKTLRELESRELLEAVIEPDRIEETLKAYGPSGALHARNKDWWKKEAYPQLKELLTPQEWSDDLWMSRNVVDVVGFRAPGGRKVVPSVHHSQMKEQAENIRAGGSVDAIAGGLVGRLMPRRHADVPVHWEDLKGLEDDIPGILTKEGRDHVVRQQREARSRWERPSPESRGALEGYRLDYLTSHRMYLDQMVKAAAANSPIDEGLVSAEALHRRHWSRKGRTAPKTGTLREPGDSVDNAFVAHEDRLGSFATERERQEYLDGFSLWDQIERSTSRLDPSWGNFVRTTVVPTAINRMRTPAFLSYANSQLAKARAARFSDPNTRMGKLLRSTPPGEAFANHLAEVAQTPGIVNTPNLGTGTARYLYVTHLGTNLSSVMLNLTQPLLLAAAVGDPGALARAYATSFREISGYLAARAKFGARSLVKGIPEAEKQRLIHENFSLTKFGAQGDQLNVVGITPDFHRVVDEMTATSVKGKGFIPRTEELMMSLFEKSEWFNRNVAGHLARNLHKKHGVPGDISTMQSDIEWLVNFTQFGASPTNRPGFLREGPLSGALFRVFLTFPTRTAMGALSTFPAMEGNSLLNNTIRGMGISAIAHELSKNFLDVDISRGLFFDATTDIFGFERIVQGEDPISARVSAINLPMSVIRGVSTGDQQELANAFSRLLPSGVAASRVLSVLPDARQTILDPVGHLQKTYVDWGDPIVGQDGRTLYPMFTPEGRLMEYRSGPELVVRGLGIDLGTFGEQGQLDHYLVKQSQAMKELRHEALRRLRVGDISGYTQIKNEFEERFSDPKTGARVPFTITKQQIRSAVDSTVRGRSERILNGLPSDYRGIYQQMVTSSGYARNVARTALLEEKTARARDPWRYTGRQDREARLRELEGRLAAIESQDRGPFGAF